MRRHDVDVFSLVVGLFFLGVALIWGLADDPGSALEGWPLPTLLIAVGVAGLVTSVGGWRGRRAGTDPAAEPTAGSGAGSGPESGPAFGAEVGSDRAG